MAAEFLTLLDHMKRRDPDGNIRESAFAELLTQNLPILEDIPIREANNGMSHLTTVRSDLPSATYRKLYEGVEQTKSRTAQVEESIGRMEAVSEIDEALIDLEGNDMSLRASEDSAFIEGMSQQAATDFVYADISTSPLKFHGLAPRYDSLGTPAGKPTANNYLNQVIDGSGTTADIQTSIWLIVWGPNTVHGIYPKGSKYAGLTMKDNGRQRVVDSNGNPYWAYSTQYIWNLGLVVKDWRYIVRIANVESTASTIDYKLFIKAYNTVPNIRAGNPVFYCNRTAKVLIDEAAAGKSNVFHMVEDPFGRPVPSIWGVPIKTLDSLLNTEAVLT